MHFRYPLSVLALSLVPVIAMADEVPTYIGEDIVVTATRFTQKRDALPVGTTVITAKDIQHSTAQNIIEVLAQQTSVHVRDNTGSPNYSVDMRGFGDSGNRNTLVLIDGQRFSEVDTSPPNWSAIPLSAIERIEILSGNGTVLYGDGATGGVINIITKQPIRDQREASVNMRAGSYATAELQVSAAVAGEALGMNLHASDLTSDNYRYNNNLRQRNLLLDLHTFGTEHSVYLKLASDSQDLRNPGMLTLAQMEANRRATTTPNDYSSWDGTRIDLGVKSLVGSGEFALNATYRDKDTRAHFDAFSSDSSTHVRQSGLAPRLNIPYVAAGIQHSLVAGLDWDDADYQRDTTGTFFNSQTRAAQDNLALYVQHSSTLAVGTLFSLGARTQRSHTWVDDPSNAISIDQANTLNAYDLAVRHPFASDWSIFARLGRSFRVASVEETPFSGTPLQPQTSFDRDAGVAYRNSATDLSAKIFQIMLDHEIAFNPLLGFFGDNANLEPTRREGLELEANLSLRQDLKTFARYTYTEAKFRSGTYSGVDLTDKTVPLVPRHMLNLGFSWAVQANTQLNVVASYLSSQRINNDFANTLNQDIPAYTTVDIGINQAFGAWRLGLTAKNALNEKYFSYGGANAMGTVKVFPAAERTLFASAEYRFR
jgi:iron complex outermembrane recepter protein